MLLETMLGVMIFALGMLALTRSVDQCLKAEAARAWDDRARLALENRMAEIEAGAVRLEENAANQNGLQEEKLEGMFKGITLFQSRTPLPLEMEPGGPASPPPRKIEGLFRVELEARWMESGVPQVKQLLFYVLPERP